MSALNCTIGCLGAGALKAAIELHQQLNGRSPAHSRLTFDRGPTSALADEFAFDKRSERPLHSVSRRCFAREAKVRRGSGAPVRRSRKQTFDPDWRLQAVFRHIAARRRLVGQ